MKQHTDYRDELFSYLWGNSGKTKTFFKDKRDAEEDPSWKENVRWISLHFAV